jgi:hypothetical protein
MYIGIPTKETEKYNDRREKKCCCYGRKGKNGCHGRKVRQGQGIKRCCYTQRTVRPQQQNLRLQKNGQKNNGEKIKPKCTMKENELERRKM